MSEFVPREFQIRSVAALRDAYSKGHRRVVLSAVMGAGKTALGFMLARSAYEKSHKPAMFVCNRDSLVDQTCASFKRFGFKKVARLQAGHFRIEDLRHADVIVASLQTLVRVQQLPELSLLMTDEVHSGWASSEKARGLVFHYTKQCPVIGLTATPFTKGLGKYYAEIDGPLFETCIQPMKASEAMSLGYIVDCDIYAPVEVDMSGVKVKTSFGVKDYDDKESAARTMKVTGDVVEWWNRLAKDKKTIAFTVNVEHATQVTMAMQENGVDAELIHGYMEAKQQQEIIGRYKRGETMMLVCPCLLGTGFDAPFTEVVLWARPTKSMTTWMQYAGRGMRASDGKEKFMVIDFVGTAQSLGYPTDDIDPKLCDGKPKRAAELEKKEKPDSKKCPSCHAVLRKRPFFPCPHCGYNRIADQLEVQDGDLRLMQRGQKGKKYKPEVGLDTYRQLMGWADEMGFKKGTAYHKYVELFNIKPKWEWGSHEPLPCPDALKGLMLRVYMNKMRRAAYAAKSFG